MSEPHEAAPEGVSEDADVADQVAVETNQSGEDAAAAETDGEGEQPKPKKSAQERINELTAARREAEREAEYWRSKATQTAQPTQAPQADASGRPDPDKFDGGVYDPAYIDALTDWKADQAVAKRFAERETQTRVQTALQSFEDKVTEQYPDGEPEGITALRRAPNLPQTVFDLITASDIGPKLADYLGTHTREFQALSAMPPHLQGRQIAQLEQKLSAPPKPNPATNAPPATPQVRGAGGRFVPGLRDDQPIEDWLAARNAQLGR